MRPVPIGAKGSFTLVVQPQHLANHFKDAILPPVLSTPVMIMIMENAALNALKAYLEPGESALGTRVDIRHLAATPAGPARHRRSRSQPCRWPPHRIRGARFRRDRGDRPRHASARRCRIIQDRRTTCEKGNLFAEINLYNSIYYNNILM